MLPARRSARRRGASGRRPAEMLDLLRPQDVADAPLGQGDVGIAQRLVLGTSRFSLQSTDSDIGR